MSKLRFTGRYLPLIIAGARCAYRTMRGNPRGVFLTRCSVKRRRLVRRRPPPVRTATRVRLHQPVRQCGNGGSFSYFCYGRRKGPLTSIFKAQQSNYYYGNGASAITIGVGVQTVNTVNCLFGANGNTLAADIASIYASITGGNNTNRVLFQSCLSE